MCAYTGEIIPSFSEGIIDRTGAQTMLYLTCTMISSIDFACYGASRAKYWVSVDSGTSAFNHKDISRCRVRLQLLLKFCPIYKTTASSDMQECVESLSV